jgi:hypothetical protein
MEFITKTIISAVIIAVVSEVSKRSPTIGAIIVSLPLTSILAIIWLYVDTQSTTKVIQLSNSIIWIVLPSIVFFIVLSLLLYKDCKFHWAMIISSAAMVISYYLYIKILSLFGINS